MTVMVDVRDSTAEAAFLRERYARVLTECEPFLVASPWGAADSVGSGPAGLGLRAPRRLDPHRVRSSDFLDLLQRLDALTYGPVGMPMPRWVFYDCAEVPGGIFGFAAAADRLPEWAREVMLVEPGYTDLVPLSMLIAIPMLSPATWLIYSLCSLNEVAAGAAPAGLRRLTYAAALSVLGVQTAYGVTRWRSARLPIHALFAPLELVTAWTPAHSEPRTLTYRFDVSGERVLDALRPEPAPTQLGDGIRWVDCDDDRVLQDLQAEVEAGRGFEVAAPPRIEGSRVRVPLREVPA